MTVALHQKKPNKRALLQAGYRKLAHLTEFPLFSRNKIDRLNDLNRYGDMLVLHIPETGGRLVSTTYAQFKARATVSISGHAYTYQALCSAIDAQPQLMDAIRKHVGVPQAENTNDKEVAELLFYDAFFKLIPDELTRQSVMNLLNQGTYTFLTEAFIEPVMVTPDEQLTGYTVTDNDVTQLDVTLKPAGGYIFKFALDTKRIIVAPKKLAPKTDSFSKRAQSQEIICPPEGSQPDALARFVVEIDGVVNQEKGNAVIRPAILSTERHEFDERVTPIFKRFLVSAPQINYTNIVPVINRRPALGENPTIRKFTNGLHKTEISATDPDKCFSRFYRDASQAGFSAQREAAVDDKTRKQFHYLLSDVRTAATKGQFGKTVTTGMLHRLEFKHGFTALTRKQVQACEILWKSGGAAALFAEYSSFSFRLCHPNLHHVKLARTMAAELKKPEYAGDARASRAYIKQQLDQLNCNPHGLFASMANYALTRYQQPQATVLFKQYASLKYRFFHPNLHHVKLAREMAATLQQTDYVNNPAKALGYIEDQKVHLKDCNPNGAFEKIYQAALREYKQAAQLQKPVASTALEQSLAPQRAAVAA